jgi:V-type H+-transporting ATPase subunit C
MEETLWAIALKPEGRMKDAQKFETLKSRVELLADVFPFRVPKEELRVGTLDSLMSLSDDLIKLDMLAEATVMKIYRQTTDMGESPLVNGVKIETYTCNAWEWDASKFQKKTPLRELSESISSKIASFDEELKLKVTEMNTLKGTIQGAERKGQGNLMVKSLVDVITDEECIMESDWMTTVFVVVPKHQYKEFSGWYERAGKEAPTGGIGSGVVPSSAKLIDEDMEYGLYRVIVFKKTADDFKQAARDKRYTVRDFKFEPGEADKAEKALEQTSKEFETTKDLLTKWCTTIFAEAYGYMMHLKAIRVFVESVLRYGLAKVANQMLPNFDAYILAPKKGKTEALRKTLTSSYGGASAMLDDGGDDSAAPGMGGGEFYPYVYVPIETQPPMQ